MSRIIEWTRDMVIELGMFGSDDRPETKRAFYDACAQFLPKTKDKRQKAAAALSLAGRSAKLGIPQNQLGRLEPSILSKAFPSGTTIVKMVKLVERFGAYCPPETALEVYSTAAAAMVREGKAAQGKAADFAAHEEIEAVKAAMREPDEDGNVGSDYISIGTARKLWQEGKENPAAADTPESVGDRVTWLLSQPLAVAEWIADPANDADRDAIARMFSIEAAEKIDKAATAAGK